ncbi:hypothetical protein Tco_1033193 [Tanacetum coccineum]|uniref:Uncharacterized protein n=1 Tax=Tanacetum coccineum TaxID=301880 RepID=A0ABQ5GDY5_9ASTR
MIVYLKNQRKEEACKFQEIEEEQIEKDTSKKTTGKRKKYLPRRRTRSTAKKQKVEQDDEKVNLKIILICSKRMIGDGAQRNYKILSEMLFDFDGQDFCEVITGWSRKIVSIQKDIDLMLWSLCHFCGVHILLMQNGIAIHMLTEKKYPLSQEMISKMLSKRLEVDQESTQAYELLKFIRSQVKK